MGLGLVLYPFALHPGGPRHLEDNPQPPLAVWGWILYPWLYLVTFALPNPLIFRWYLTPPLPAYFFFIFAGLEFLLLRFKRANPRRPPLGCAAGPSWPWRCCPSWFPWQIGAWSPDSGPIAAAPPSREVLR